MAEVEEHGRRGLSRRQLIAMAGGSAATAAFIAACGSDDSAEGSETSQFGEGDVGIVNYALLLEHLEAALYADVVGSDLFDGSDLEMLRKFDEEEAEHVQELTNMVERMDGEPEERPETEFLFEDARSALALAAKIENLVAAAYLDQVPNIESKPTMERMLSIHSVEGRHAAALDTLLGRPFTPDGEFAKPARVDVVLASIEPFMAT